MYLVKVESNAIAIYNTEFEWKETFNSIEYTLLRYKNLLELVKENKPNEVPQMPDNDNCIISYFEPSPLVNSMLFESHDSDMKESKLLLQSHVICYSRTVTFTISLSREDAIEVLEKIVNGLSALEFSDFITFLSKKKKKKKI